MTTTSIIALHDITFRYSSKSQPVLDGFSMTLHENQRLGLIGPNGSGKTTLFHIIMGLLKPDSGSLSFRGAEVRNQDDFKALRRDVGLLFQDSDDQLFSPTVIEDVAFGPLNFGAGPEEAEQKALHTLESLGLYGFADRITHQLSGGEKKLVSLATILAMEPKALLLDEPTNNLDPSTRIQLIEILRNLGIGYVIISHDWEFIAQTCEDVYVMNRGKVKQSGIDALHKHGHLHNHGDRQHQHVFG